MTVTSGFFNGADRPADARDISSIFEGMISDGIYDTIGTAFAVTAAGGNFLNLGTGRAWFNQTWTKNDAVVVYEAPVSELLLDRYDCMVLEVDHSDAVRNNRIFLLSGTPSSNPVLPELSNGPLKFQYLIAAILRHANSAEIQQIDITPYQGTEQTPFVNGLLEKFSIQTILTQYQEQSLLLLDNLEQQLLTIQETGVPVHGPVHFIDGSDPIIKRFLIEVSNIWSGSSAPYTKDINVIGITADMVGTPKIIYSNLDSLATRIAQETAFSKVSDCETGNGILTLTCFKSKPDVSFNIILEVAM